LEIDKVYRSSLPGNAAVYSTFIYSWPLQIVDQAIAGILNAGADGQAVDEYQHSSFRDYDMEKEQRFKRVLSRLDYLIDDQDKLVLVTGPGCLEEVGLFSTTVL